MRDLKSSRAQYLSEKHNIYPGTTRGKLQADARQELLDMIAKITLS